MNNVPDRPYITQSELHIILMDSYITRVYGSKYRHVTLTITPTLKLFPQSNHSHNPNPSYPLARQKITRLKFNFPAITPTTPPKKRTTLISASHLIYIPNPSISSPYQFPNQYTSFSTIEKNFLSAPSSSSSTIALKLAVVELLAAAPPLYAPITYPGGGR